MQLVVSGLLNKKVAGELGSSEVTINQSTVFSPQPESRACETFRDQRKFAMLTERTGIRIETVRLAEYHKQTVARHLVLILDFYGFRRVTRNLCSSSFPSGAGSSLQK
jgi:hypothetical protein